jgi:hypothetical protein
MKLSDYRKTYYEYSGKASDVARQLSFAGIALVWVFKLDSKPIPNIPEQLFFPAALLTAALALDLLQYTISAMVWGSFARSQEKLRSSKEEDPILSAPRFYNWPGLSFFWTKIVVVIWAYMLIFKYIFFVGAFTYYPDGSVVAARISPRVK